MHAANAYLLSISRTDVGSILTPTERQRFLWHLQEDAQDYYQAGLMTFVDALRSIEEGFYSWATIKLYYSVFYALRSRLALAGDCLFYANEKPRLITEVYGSKVVKQSGNSHKIVLDRFERTHPYDFFVSQTIGQESPLRWLIKVREQTNYTLPRFSEPVSPAHLNYAARSTSRQLLSSYLADDVYVHDEDHAILAFPFRMLIDVRSRLGAQGITPLGPSEAEFVTRQLTDKAGLISAATSLTT